MSEKDLTNLANTAYKNYTDTAFSDLREKTNMVFDSLVTHAGTNMSVLPEDIFVGVFLPYFCGETKITQADDIMSKWVGIAGTAMSEVSVIDHAGNELFKVPAIFDTSVIEVVRRPRGDSLADIMTEYELRNNNIPAVANRYLHDALASKSERITKGVSELSPNEKRWMDIFTRYGKTNASAVVKEETSNPEDDIDYE